MAKMNGGDNVGVQNDGIKNEGRSFEDAMRRTKPIVIGMSDEQINDEIEKMLSIDIDEYVGKNVSADK